MPGEERYERGYLKSSIAGYDNQAWRRADREIGAPIGSSLRFRRYNSVGTNKFVSLRALPAAAEGFVENNQILGYRGLALD
jgi:hypothetical protein